MLYLLHVYTCTQQGFIQDFFVGGGREQLIISITVCEVHMLPQGILRKFMSSEAASGAQEGW